MDRSDQGDLDVAGLSLPTRLVDGYQVHRASLSRDLDTLSLPRQVLLAGDTTTVPAQISFTHGVPEASVLSAVTFAQDRRLTRALLERADVPKPKGASFSWKSIAKAERWASNLGFPVILREGVGENPARSVRQIASGEELRQAFSELRRRDKHDRTPGSNPHIAGYATTRLTFTHDEEGNEVAPLRSRMLVEKEPRGRVLRAFVVGGAVIAAVELNNQQTSGTREVTQELGPDVSGIFIRATEAVPGLACATVDAVVSTDIASGLEKTILVTSVSERPRIETYLPAGSLLGDRIGDALLKFQAAAAGLELGPEIDSVTRQVEIEGLRHASDVAEHLPATAERHGGKFEINHVDPVTGEITAWAKGSPDLLAALAELLMAGELIDDRAAAVNYSKGQAK